MKTESIAFQKGITQIASNRTDLISKGGTFLTFSEKTGEPIAARSSKGFLFVGWSKLSSKGFAESAYSILSSSSRKGLKPFF